MHPLLCSVPTLAVSLIFCLYQSYRDQVRWRQRRLRERVTYMLWVMARDVMPDPSPTQQKHVEIS
jgi:hypothetical protein